MVPDSPQKLDASSPPSLTANTMGAAIVAAVAKMSEGTLTDSILRQPFNASNASVARHAAVRRAYQGSTLGAPAGDR